MSQTVENEEDNDVADEKHRVSNFLSSTQGVAAVTAIKVLSIYVNAKLVGTCI